MALIKCPECGREVSDKAAACPNCGYALNKQTEKTSSNPKSKKTWLWIIIAFIAIIAIGIISWVMIGSNNRITDSNAEDSHQASTHIQSPDMTLFEVSGQVKEIFDIENPVLPIHTHAGKSIKFSKDGVWDNYTELGKDEDYTISINRDSYGQIIQLSGSNPDYEWSVEYEWNNGNPSCEILNGTGGGDATTLEYNDNKLVSVISTGNDIDDKYVNSYKIKKVNTDSHGNWVERIWEHITEGYSYNYEVNGYSEKPDFVSSEEVIEKRSITYWD